MPDSNTDPQVQAKRPLLFTAFEPSGDARAAGVIAALLQRDPSVEIFACGGPRMEAAGATLIEETAVDGAMGLGALSHAMAVRKVQRNIARWASRYRVVAHIAVDSPAANFPICRMMKKQGACVAHLVAPQLWAWGGWRIKKLRRLSDLVLCLLPFEESWFMSRQVNARFIGHPVINRSIDEAELQQRRNTLPQGSPRILVLPGSRSGEVRKNTRMLVAAFTEIQGRFRGTTGLVVASDDRVARQVRKLVPAMPTGLHLAIGDLDAAINWCDLALTVSGTVTLDLARQTRPMIGVYKTDPLSWIGSKLLLRTRYKLLPNIVLRQEVVPEFVPCLGRVGPIVQEAAELLKDTRNLAKVSEGLRHVTKQFDGHDPDREAAEMIHLLITRGSVGFEAAMQQAETMPVA